jgi:hypothetical protein
MLLFFKGLKKGESDFCLASSAYGRFLRALGISAKLDLF